jgi:hypothetical protein
VKLSCWVQQCQRLLLLLLLHDIVLLLLVVSRSRCRLCQVLRLMLPKAKHCLAVALLQLLQRELLHLLLRLHAQDCEVGCCCCTPGICARLA